MQRQPCGEWRQDRAQGAGRRRSHRRQPATGEPGWAALSAAIPRATSARRRITGGQRNTRKAASGRKRTVVRSARRHHGRTTTNRSGGQTGRRPGREHGAARSHQGDPAVGDGKAARARQEQEQFADAGALAEQLVKPPGPAATGSSASSWAWPLGIPASGRRARVSPHHTSPRASTSGKPAGSGRRSGENPGPRRDEGSALPSLGDLRQETKRPGRSHGKDRNPWSAWVLSAAHCPPVVPKDSHEVAADEADSNAFDNKNRRGSDPNDDGFPKSAFRRSQFDEAIAALQAFDP